MDQTRNFPVIRLCPEINSGLGPEAFHKLVGSTPEQDETCLSQLFYCELVEFMVDIVPRQIMVESFKIAIEAQRHEQVNVSHSNTTLDVFLLLRLLDKLANRFP